MIGQRDGCPHFDVWKRMVDGDFDWMSCFELENKDGVEDYRKSFRIIYFAVIEDLLSTVSIYSKVSFSKTFEWIILKNKSVYSMERRNGINSMCQSLYTFIRNPEILKL